MNLYTLYDRWRWWSQTTESKKWESILDILRRDPAAYSLYESARTEGISFVLAEKMVGSGINGHYDFAGKSIELDPARAPFNIAETLAHELRHYWQDKTMGLTAENKFHILRSPMFAFIYCRVIEADACSFAAQFQRVAGKTGQPPNARSFARDFKKVLKGRWLSNNYDMINVKRIHLWNTATPAHLQDSSLFKDVPEITIKDIRSMLKAGVTENDQNYLEDVTDTQFIAMTLQKANMSAARTLCLIENFKQAIAESNQQEARQLAQTAQRTFGF